MSGGRAVVELENDVVYLAIGLRNVGSGLALLHGWFPYPFFAISDTPPTTVEEFRRLGVDLYIAPGGAGYWESAIRDAADPLYAEFVRIVETREPFTIDLLYGDQDGGQRTVSRCVVLPASDGGWYTQIARHWNIDRPDPR